MKLEEITDEELEMIKGNFTQFHKQTPDAVLSDRELAQLLFEGGEVPADIGANLNLDHPENASVSRPPDISFIVRRSDNQVKNLGSPKNNLPPP